MAKSKTVERRREAMGGLAKGLGVMRAFTGDRAALTLSDIAGIAAMPAATARRCLLTLEYVRRPRLDPHLAAAGSARGQPLPRACHLHRPGFARRLEYRADRTVTDPVKLRQLIEDCRRTGYSVIEDELAYGVVALAVPVFDQQGRVVAALNSSGHSRHGHIEIMARAQAEGAVRRAPGARKR